MTVRKRRHGREPYIGSVRFYKNIILAVVIIMIAVPAVFAFVYKGKYKKLSEAEPEPVVVETEAEEEPVPTRTVTITDEAGNTRTIEVKAEAPGDVTDLQQYAAATETLEYQQLFPDMYAPQELVVNDRQSDSIYLTYDGVMSDVTDGLIELLAEKNVKATFFVQGEPVGSNAMRIETLASHGHTIGMMGCSQEYDKIYESVEAYLTDLYTQFTAIKSVTGVAPTAVRLPGGSVNSYNHGTYKAIIAELLRRGFVPYDWTVSGEDDTIAIAEDGTETAPDANTIATRIIASCESYSRSIVQLHDNENSVNTVEATNLIINTLMKEGYTFRAVETNTMPVLFSYPDYKEDVVYEE